jgi:hypothetical protein
MIELVSDVLPRNIKLIKFLQVHPKIRARPKILAKPQRRVARDSAAAAQNVGNPGSRDLDRAGKFSGAHLEFLQLVRKVFPRVYGSTRHFKRF